MKTIFILSLSFLLATTINAQVQATASVLVTDFKDQPIKGAQIFFFDTDQDRTLTGTSDVNGKFSVQLEPGTYNIRLKHDGKTKDYTFIEIPTLKANEEYGEVQIQIQYEASSSFVLTDLHFETSSDVIQDISFSELDQLADYLKKNTSVKIEIAGHTDGDGTLVENSLLSMRRAASVKNYLASKGVKEDRMTPNGYGESQPISDNTTVMGKSLNRRTEIHFLDDAGNRLK